MAAEAGLREALDLADILGASYRTTLDLLARGPMAAVVKRALDRDNPRAIRDLAIDFDVLVLQAAKRTCRSRRLVDVGFGPLPSRPPPPVFFDLTTHTTALPRFRDLRPRD